VLQEKAFWVFATFSYIFFTRLGFFLPFAFVSGWGLFLDFLLRLW